LLQDPLSGFETHYFFLLFLHPVLQLPFTLLQKTNAITEKLNFGLSLVVG